MRKQLAFRCAALAVVLALGGAGCRRHKVAVRDTDEAPGRLRSVVDMSDPRTAGQLLSGFHAMEDSAWRWTAREFSVNLARPPEAAQKGATLTVRLTVPPVSIGKLKSLKLSAAVNGAPLDPQTYTASGNYVYRRDVPANLLRDDPVRVDFSLDKAIPPGNPDVRELGLVVLSVGLQTR